MFVDIGSTLFVDSLRDAFPSSLRTVLRETFGTGEGAPVREFTACNGEVYDFADLPCFPCPRLVIGVSERLTVDLFGAELVAWIAFHEADDLSGQRVLLSEKGLFLYELLFHAFAEVRAEIAGAVLHHDFRPELVEVGAGSGFIAENVDVGSLWMYLHWQKTAVPGSVHGQKIHSVGGSGEHTLPRAVCWKAVVGHLVGVLAAGEEGLDFLDV